MGIDVDSDIVIGRSISDLDMTKFIDYFNSHISESKEYNDLCNDWWEIAYKLNLAVLYPHHGAEYDGELIIGVSISNNVEAKNIPEWAKEITKDAERFKEISGKDAVLIASHSIT